MVQVMDEMLPLRTDLFKRVQAEDIDKELEIDLIWEINLKQTLVFDKKKKKINK